MNNNIYTYKDLLLEKRRLKALLELQKKTIQDEVEGIKVSLKPMNLIVHELSKFTTRSHSAGILNTGVNFGLDWLLKKVILRKAGWLTRLVATPIIKNLASHLVSSEVGKIPSLKKLLKQLK